MPKLTINVGLREHQPAINDLASVRIPLIGNEKSIIKALNQGFDVDATGENLSYKTRRGLLDATRSLDIKRVARLHIGEFENVERLGSFYPPYYNEGYDFIEVVYSGEKFPYTKEQFLYKLKAVEQNHPNHSLTVGSHCEKTGEILKDARAKDYVYLAGLLHDVGKYYTKGMKEDGTSTFYGHHNVGAYLIFHLLRDVPKNVTLRIAFLVAWHMTLKMADSVKGLEKVERFLQGNDYGNVLINEIKLIDEADTYAR